MDETTGQDCEQLRSIWDRASQARVLVAVHDTRLGPAHGGIRRWAYPDVHAATLDVVALARAMTWKCALAEVPAGGGKAVILDHPGLDRAGAYRAVGRAVEALGGAFYTGPDVNTTARGTSRRRRPTGCSRRCWRWLTGSGVQSTSFAASCRGSARSATASASGSRRAAPR